MERYIGLDVGDRTIGVAISDPFLLTAQSLMTIKRKSKIEDIEIINGIIKEKEVSKIIVGLPKNMNNTIGPQAKKVKTFVKELRKHTDLDIEYVDERLTTVSATRVLIEQNVSRKKRKDVIDSVAATYILQTYLDMGR
ncbi:Holliday junction resolvase RuvX [Finegoldia magna]|uniref:Putative pre-16S rRNA nuclease n=2 Tax=Finegoldia magna TaxID=1260 RepID=A0A233W8N6_FINMA|nr:Holliday junction resolvase RuvX [Finegoldia magna]EFK93596.1 RNAse H domain protein, YqgF family [Finegoldia magna ACS-171-V-Col3]EFL54575.1 RNAse H domain protein, YqgF family [Finegoldia magna BVS033A4]EGS32302.1 RNAse H domain protein, YqgF family [Finegoldia magna SY403409CC001050417]EXF27027.1 Holliday junction resolvase [Finegoldia magna ALB8]MDU4731810.1 Holliday junction resolvase RuvX [Finegoldia magna]